MAQNVIVTITYPNGAALKAIVLSLDEHEIRSIAPGGDDPLVFTRDHGTWISEELEPVTLEFEWQRYETSLSCVEEDCICPK